MPVTHKHFKELGREWINASYEQPEYSPIAHFSLSSNPTTLPKFASPPTSNCASRIQEGAQSILSGSDSHSKLS